MSDDTRTEDADTAAASGVAAADCAPGLTLEEAAQGFAAIGSEARLAVVLALVKAGSAGLTVGDIQARTGMAASTLAHHLRFLAAGGLIFQEKQGRAVISRAAFDRLEHLAGFIMKECCADEWTPDAPAPDTPRHRTATDG
ncbi:metalloregulator ArsR/SmtB family transcription factor [Stappia sp.]|uniref:ArsR/SmtB family transcription factor n=1 Tax=Stappia sp. TaxID=1870903 RepID=UPI0032D8EA23